MFTRLRSEWIYCQHHDRSVIVVVVVIIVTPISRTEAYS
jgi:hypothetical protein